MKIVQMMSIDDAMIPLLLFVRNLCKCPNLLAKKEVQVSFVPWRERD